MANNKTVKKDVEELVDTEMENTSAQEIEVNDPMSLRPKDLPLVVKLPEGASIAQVEYAKTLNAYAYQNPEKWAVKKDVLIERLKSLAGVNEIKESNLKINNTSM